MVNESFKREECEMSRDGKQRHYSKNSVFVRTMIILVTMFLVLLGFFMGVVWRLLSHVQEKRIEENNVQMLEQTSEMLELALQMTLSEVNQIQWNEQVISYMIRSGEKDSGSELDIIRLLQSSVQENNMIWSVWIYGADQDWILCENGFSGISEEFADGSLILGHKPSNKASYPDNHERTAKLVAEDSRLFWIQDMVLARHIGSVCMEVDVKQLYETLQMGDGDAFIYDGEGRLILAEGDVAQIPEGFHPGQAVNGRIIEGNDTWYVTENASMGLYLVQRQQSASLNMGWDILPILLPGCLLYILVGLGGAYLVTKGIYKPINQLVGTVLSYRREAVPDDELAYLKLSFFQTMSESDRLRQSMNYFQEDILEQVFRKLLQGCPLEDAGVYELNESLKHHWLGARQYQVIVCWIQEGEAVASDLNLNPQLYYQSIRQIVQDSAIASGQAVVSMEPEFIAIILADSEHSVFGFKTMVQSLEQKIQDGYPLNAMFRIRIAHGRTYTQLEDLVYSWQEARKRARYSAYLENSSVDQADDEKISGDDMDRSQYYEDRALQIFEHVVKNQKKEACDLLDRVVDELTAGLDSPDKIWKYFEILKDTFLEKCLTVAGRADMDSLEIPLKIASCEDTNKKMKEYLRQQIEQLWLATQKKTYRYMEHALRYIQENFADSNLSGQMVAEYLHITSNYFSEIFNEQMKESFTGYLNRIRVENARTLLIETDIAIRDIGFKCGFNTVQHFNRMFKKYSKVTPKQYREMKDS